MVTCQSSDGRPQAAQAGLFDALSTAVPRPMAVKHAEELPAISLAPSVRSTCTWSDVTEVHAYGGLVVEARCTDTRVPRGTVIVTPLFAVPSVSAPPRTTAVAGAGAGPPVVEAPGTTPMLTAVVGGAMALRCDPAAGGVIPLPQATTHAPIAIARVPTQSIRRVCGMSLLNDDAGSRTGVPYLHECVSGPNRLGCDSSASVASLADPSARICRCTAHRGSRGSGESRP